MDKIEECERMVKEYSTMSEIGVQRSSYLTYAESEYR